MTEEEEEPQNKHQHLIIPNVKDNEFVWDQTNMKVYPYMVEPT